MLCQYLMWEGERKKKEEEITQKKKQLIIRYIPCRFTWLDPFRVVKPHLVSSSSLTIDHSSLSFPQQATWEVNQKINFSPSSSLLNKTYYSIFHDNLFSHTFSKSIYWVLTWSSQNKVSKRLIDRRRLKPNIIPHLSLNSAAATSTHIHLPTPITAGRISFLLPSHHRVCDFASVHILSIELRVVFSPTLNSHTPSTQPYFFLSSCKHYHTKA